MVQEYDHTCECGQRWHVVPIKTAMRGSDSIECHCGREIIRWNGGHMFRVTAVATQDSSGPGNLKATRPSRPHLP